MNILERTNFENGDVEKLIDSSMFTNKRKFAQALKRNGIAYKSTTDATGSLEKRMGDFVSCPCCGSKIFDYTFNFKKLYAGEFQATFKHIELEPSINNTCHHVAVVVECKSCFNTIWRHVALVEF